MQKTNMAGTPYAFLTVALLAIATLQGGYERKTITAAISRPKKIGSSTEGTSHSRRSN
jgi:hypothetical protein